MSSEALFFMPVVPCAEDPGMHTFICPNCGDPHGLFVHQETILKPKGYINHFDQIDDPANETLSELELWHKYFPSLGHQ